MPGSLMTRRLHAALRRIVAGVALPLVQGRQHRADDRRRLAALGDADDDVALPDPPVLELQPADERQVLEAFERADQGPVGPGHLAHEGLLDPGPDPSLEPPPDLPVRLDLAPERAPEGALHLLRQPSGRAAPVDVDPPPPEDGRLDRPRRLFKRLGGRGELVHLGPHVLVDRGQHLQAGPRVLADPFSERPGLLMALFREQGVELELGLCLDVIDRFGRRLDAQELEEVAAAPGRLLPPRPGARSRRHQAGRRREEGQARDRSRKRPALHGPTCPCRTDARRRGCRVPSSRGSSPRRGRP
jgi:hypothetical protein